MNILSIKTDTEAGKWGAHLGSDAQSGFLIRQSREDKWYKYFKTHGKKSEKAKHTCLDVSGTTATGDFRTKKHYQPSQAPPQPPH